MSLLHHTDLEPRAGAQMPLVHTPALAKLEHAGGNASPAAEFNFWFDPEAAEVVLRSRIPEKIMIPLDICNRAVITRTMFDEIVDKKTPITDRYREDAGLRYPGFLNDSAATAFLWDELAAAWLIDPGFMTKSKTMLLISIHDSERRTAFAQYERLLTGSTQERVL